MRYIAAGVGSSKSLQRIFFLFSQLEERIYDCFFSFIFLDFFLLFFFCFSFMVINFPVQRTWFVLCKVTWILIQEGAFPVSASRLSGRGGEIVIICVNGLLGIAHHCICSFHIVVTGPVVSGTWQTPVDTVCQYEDERCGRSASLHYISPTFHLLYVHPRTCLAYLYLTSCNWLCFC